MWHRAVTPPRRSCSDEHAGSFLLRDSLLAYAAASAVLRMYVKWQQTPTTADQQAAPILPLRALAARASGSA